MSSVRVNVPYTTLQTSIIYAAFAQFILSLPMAVYYIFLGFFVGEAWFNESQLYQGISTTALMCTILHSGTIIAEFSAHLVITVRDNFKSSHS